MKSSNDGRAAKLVFAYGTFLKRRAQQVTSAYLLEPGKSAFGAPGQELTHSENWPHGTQIALGIRLDDHQRHTDASIKADVTKEEIVDALGVAIMANASAALVHSVRAIDAFDAKTL